MEALQHVESEFAFLMDTDAIWLCNATEVIRKRSQLIREANSSENSVVMFAEKGMWPPYQYFHGINLRLNQTAGYPPLSNGSYFRFINSGAALGRPQDLLAMYRCMAERYEEFPHACPAGHSESGKLLYYRESDGYRQPPVDRKNHAQQQRYQQRYGQQRQDASITRHGNWGLCSIARASTTIISSRRQWRDAARDAQNDRPVRAANGPSKCDMEVEGLPPA